MGTVRWVVATVARRRRVWLGAVAVTLGLGMGFALASAVGAHRASTAYDRLAEATLAPDALVNLPDAATLGPAAALAKLDGVTAATRMSYVPVAPAGLKAAVEAGAFGFFDDSFATSIYRPLIITGRLPAPGRANEITVNEALADLADLSPGDEIELRGGSFQNLDADLGRARVVGIHRGTFDVGANAGNPSMLLPPAFMDAHGSKLVSGGGASLLRLARGELGVPRATQQVNETLGTDAFVISAEDDSESTRHGLGIQMVGFTVLAVVSLLAVGAGGGQALRRHVDSEREDLEVLKALGADHATRRLILLVPVAAVAIAAGATAVATAALASPLLRLGLTRDVDPEAGLYIVPWLLAGGFVAIVAALIAAVATSLRTVAPTGEPLDQPRRVPGRPAVTVGLRPLAGGSRGRASRAARGAVVGVLVGSAGVAATAIVAASLERIGRDPHVHGWSTAAAISSENPDIEAVKSDLAFVEEDAAVDRVVWASVSTVESRSVTFEVIGLDGAGALHPTLLEGRAPAAKDEIALGSEVLHRLDAHVGQHIQVALPAGPRALHVVGRAVYPALGANGDPDTVGSMTFEGFRDLGVESYQTLALVDVADEGDIGALAARVQEHEAEMFEPFPAPKIDNLDTLGALPLILIAFLSLLVVAAVGHSLVVSVRARRREFAVLRTLGLVPSQARAAVFWQATATVFVGAAIGIVLGTIAGRQAWRLVAENVGILNRPDVPLPVLLAVLLTALVAANVLAALPARAAARLRPAAVLRTE